MNRTRLGRTLASLVAGTFLFAASGHAYALHACPHHDRAAPAGAHGASGPDGSGARDGAAAAGAHGIHQSPESPAHHAGGPGEDEGPCTCVGSCHSTATASAGLHLGGARVAPPLAPRLSLDLPGTGLPYAPRLGLYELHQPNAPPPLLRSGRA